VSVENPFWSFSCAVYAREGVADACLRLQDRFGLDVNILLFCCWAAREGAGALDAVALDRVVAQTAAWRDDVVRPLRAVRRTLKGGVSPMSPVPSEQLREAVKRLELEAERIQQAALAEALPPRPRPLAPVAARRDDAMTSLIQYFEARGCAPDAAARHDLALLVDAAFADG